MFSEPLEIHPDDRSSIDSRDTTASSEWSDCSNERAAPSPAAGDDVTMPIVIDDADATVPSDVRMQRSTPSPTKPDTTDRETADHTVPLQKAHLTLIRKRLRRSSAWIFTATHGPWSRSWPMWSWSPLL
eukprot:1753059-Pleurochrysis_carterae.AAC.1